jgi:hypothetical protein
MAQSDAVQSMDDLGGQSILVRRSSSYYTHLLAIDEARKAANKPLIKIKLADEALEDEDLLEMASRPPQLAASFNLDQASDGRDWPISTNCGVSPNVCFPPVTDQKSGHSDIRDGRSLNAISYPLLGVDRT